MSVESTAVRPRVIIDTDPGHDDFFAIALASRLCDVVALTAVAGNSPLANTERNSLIARELFGMDQTEVHAGAANPLAGEPVANAVEAHGNTGLDGPPARTPTRPLDGTDAVEYLVEKTRAEEGLWIVPIGPLTNIALALRADPGFASRIAGLSFMGGSATHGNVTSAAEFNVWFDPEAASEVLHARISNVLMFGLNFSHQVCADATFYDSLVSANTERSLFLAGLLKFSLEFNADIYGLGKARWREVAAPMHDPCALVGVCAATGSLSNELVAYQRRHVVVETAGTYTRGLTLLDARPWKEGADTNTIVAQTAPNAAQILKLILDASI